MGGSCRFFFTMTPTNPILSELSFFTWRSALCSALQSPAWLKFLTDRSLTMNPTFSALSFQDGFPNCWFKGAFLLPIASWVQGTKADLAHLIKAINIQAPPLIHKNQPLDAYIQIEAPNRHFLTFTLSALAWAKLSLHTLSTSILPTAATCAAPSLAPILEKLWASQAWHRAHYRLAWLRKADSRLSWPQPLWLTPALELYSQPQLCQLLSQAESLCFYYDQLAKNGNSLPPPLTTKRLEGQLANLLKDFHDFYRNVKILSGDLAKQKALLNLALAVGYALNLYNLRLTDYGSYPGSFGKVYP